MLKVVNIKKFGTSVILCLHGRIVIGGTLALRETVAGLTGVTSVVFDLNGVSLIDAHGLGLMLELRGELKAKGVEFRLMHVTERVRRIFEITRLNTVFEIMSPQKLLTFSRKVPPQFLASCA
jgi:anti-sigma B factor antagonist